MTGDQYRIIAAELQAKAANEQNEMIAIEWNNLARAYLKHARQAEKNTDGFYSKIGQERRRCVKPGRDELWVRM